MLFQTKVPPPPPPAGWCGVLPTPPVWPTTIQRIFAGKVKGAFDAAPLPPGPPPAPPCAPGGLDDVVAGGGNVVALNRFGGGKQEGGDGTHGAVVRVVLEKCVRNGADISLSVVSS